MPAAVRKALELGWRTSSITRRYDVTRKQVICWRHQVGLQSSEAQSKMRAAGVDPWRAQDLVTDHGFRAAARELGVQEPWLRKWAREGAILYHPEDPGGRKRVMGIRLRLIQQMTDEGHDLRTMAAVLGITPRWLRVLRGRLRKEAA